jgi:hypothetical protein
MSFFEFRTPRDMLEKARREHARLTASVTIDNVFNFFVSAYHIQDYIRQNRPGLTNALKEFIKDQDFKDTRNICDKGKHMLLQTRHQPITTRRRIGAINTAPLNTLPINASKDEWTLLTGNRTVDVLRLAERVLSKWDAFFTAQGL